MHHKTGLMQCNFDAVKLQISTVASLRSGSVRRILWKLLMRSRATATHKRLPHLLLDTP